MCNVTRTSGSVKYCIIPPGVGSQSFLFNNWIKQGNGIFEPEHNIVKSGSTSVKIYSSDPSSYIYSSALYSALKGNRNYLLEFWARGELQNDAIRYAIVDVQNQMYLAPSGQWNSLNPGADIFITKQLSTTFERITQPFSTLQNAVIELRFYTPLNNQVVYLDDVSVTEINDFTMSVWIRPYTGQGSFARLFYQLGQEFGAAQGIDWFLNPANFLNISFYSANGSGQSSQISHLLDLSDGNWHMVSVSVRRLGEYNIYLDDKSVASGQFSLLRINSSSPFFIGASDSSGSNGFRGLIDEIRFYKRALSEREIENHYKGLYQDKCSLDLDVFYKPSASFSNITANYNAKLRLKRQLPDALLSLPFDYREVEGISVDYSPLLLHANVSANWTPFGKIGGAYNFTSLFSHLSVPSPVLQGRDDFTVSLWVKPKSVISSQIISNQIQNSGFALELSDGYLNFIAANKVISSPIELATDEWTHITVSRKDGVGFIYINGVLYATGDVSGDLGQTYPRLIIGNSPSLNKPYEGIIDEVQIFKRALSEDEIRALYNQGFTVSITTLNS
ncbi:MAG: LamG domain-containing protein [Candidatus Anstonellaceae archaeon]